jgi:hypothetical protein
MTQRLRAEKTDVLSSISFIAHLPRYDITQPFVAAHSTTTLASRSQGLAALFIE